MPDYGQYSRIGEQAAGEYWSGGSVCGKWAWNPDKDAPSTSSIQWGTPIAWPPLYRELFDRETHNGADKLFLRGWYDNGTFYSMHVDSQQIRDDTNTAWRNVAPHAEGWQLYAYWDVTSWTYTLDTRGHLLEEATGNQISFYHRMTWYPPAHASNAYCPARDCISFYEDWWDDNPTLDGVLVRKVARTNWLAKGAGMAWKIRQTYSNAGPSVWGADLKSWWTWPR